ncbi:MAG: glycosyltransferase family 4 protein [Candidatus Thermoplasmatota archaeon]
MSPYIKSLGYDIAIVASVGQKYFRNYWNGIYVFPGTEEDNYAENVILYYLKEWYDRTGKPPILFQQTDMWSINEIPRFAQQKQLLWVLYPALDYDPIPNDIINRMSGAFAIIPMCKWAENTLRNTRIKEKILPFVHHGVNEKIYHPLAESKEKIMENYPKTLKSLGFGKDSFNITIVAANQIFRKPWDAFFQIVRKFRDNNPDIKVRLYCHTLMDVARGGWNLSELAKFFKLEDITIFSDPVSSVSGAYSEEDLSRIYNVSSVLLYTTYSEGFGLPVIESLACGTPVLTTDFTATGELVEPFPEFKVKVAGYFLVPRPLLVKAQPDIDDAVEKMTKIANSNLDDYLKICSEYAHKNFSWKHILPQWKDRLEKVEQLIDEQCIEVPEAKKSAGVIKI